MAIYMLVVLNAESNWEILDTANSLESITKTAKSELSRNPWRKTFIYELKGFYSAEIVPKWVGMEKEEEK